MKTIFRCALSACLFCAGAARADVPVIQLAPTTDDAVEQLADGVPLSAPGALPSAPAALPGAADAATEQAWLGAGSFALYAGGAFSALGSVAAVMPSTARLHDGVLVAARPLPRVGPVLLLVAGCFIYLGRRRRHGFSLRPARGLLARSGHAPAFA